MIGAGPVQMRQVVEAAAECAPGEWISVSLGVLAAFSLLVGAVASALFFADKNGVSGFLMALGAMVGAAMILAIRTIINLLRAMAGSLARLEQRG